MTKTDEGGGGAVGKLWRKHGGGYYALLAVGTFMYLEFMSLTTSIREAAGMGDFLISELLLAAGENFPFVADEKVTARRPRTGRGG